MSHVRHLELWMPERRRGYPPRNDVSPPREWEGEEVDGLSPPYPWRQPFSTFPGPPQRFTARVQVNHLFAFNLTTQALLPPAHPPPHFIKNITELFQIPSKNHLPDPLLPPLFHALFLLLPLFHFSAFRPHAAIHFQAEWFSPKPPTTMSGPLHHLIATFS